MFTIEMIDISYFFALVHMAYIERCTVAAEAWYWVVIGAEMNKKCARWRPGRGAGWR